MAELRSARYETTPRWETDLLTVGCGLSEVAVPVARNWVYDRGQTEMNRLERKNATCGRRAALMDLGLDGGVSGEPA